MAKRKTDDELLRELGLFNHLEAQRRFLQLMEENKELRSRRVELEADHFSGPLVYDIEL